MRREEPSATKLNAEHREDYLRRMTTIAERAMDRLRGGRDDLHPVLWRLTTEQVARTLADFIDANIKLFSGRAERVPSYLEVSFGQRRRRGVSDELSSPDKLVLDLKDEEPASIAGKIDRIDQVTGTPGGFVVVDYKTGKSLASAKQIERGTSLQLPLYVLAAERVLLKDEGARALSAELYGLREQKPKVLMRRTGSKDDEAEWTNLIETVVGCVGEYVGGIRRGEFPVFVREDQRCPAHCEFKRICRYSERRALKKSEGWKPWMHRKKE